MNLLCVSTDLSSGDLAAWVQAIGTIIAVLASAGIAIWQSKAQHQSSLALHKAERRSAQIELAKTLFILCRNCTNAATHFAKQVNSREALHRVASGEVHFDFEELHALQNATTNIPLHSLPDRLVGSAMTLAATFRQLRQAIELALKLHRSMDASEFTRHFTNMEELIKSLELTCGDIETALRLVEQDG